MRKLGNMQISMIQTHDLLPGFNILGGNKFVCYFRKIRNIL
jgi:hypothetical protein